MSSKPSIEETRARRRQGVRWLKRGMQQAEIARRLEVSRQSVSVWAKALASGQEQALRQPRPRGRPAQLDALQRRQLQRLLKAGALAAGFPTELWTLPRIRVLIAERFGVSLSESWIFRLLRQLGWSCQRPARQARERDEAAIRQWKQVRWPRLKKARRGKAG
jgi:transposase